jgi:pullulanase-type alpha-1,6-glucosidase
MMLSLRYLVAIFAVLLVVACAQPDAQKRFETTDLISWLALNETDVSAHWVRRDIVLLADASAAKTVYLAEYEAGEGGALAETSIQLVPVEMPAEVAAKFPHLKDFAAFDVGLPAKEIIQLVRGELMVVQQGEDSGVISASYVQIPGVLDDLFTTGADDADEVPDYGATVRGDGVQFRLWAPTAKTVAVKLYDADYVSLQTIEMVRDDATGVWTAQAGPEADRQFYRYEMTLYHPATRRVETLEVTDPYSLSLSTNSQFSQVVDLSAPDTKPEGWDTQEVVTVDRPEQLIIYEAHIADFSGTDETVPAAHRGKYKAFSEQASDGVTHLKKLQAAGLNVIHLLPTYDLGSIIEFEDQRVTLDDTVGKACALIDPAPFCETADPEQTLWALLQSYDVASADAQAVVEAIDEVDDYNWGYDPFHYTVPEGSYAVNPEGVARVREFREMVQRLHALGFRVVMDVVYNHTFKAGLHEKSVLDKVVPGYYHRLDPISGEIAQSTCCDNTATEHRMMAKLMNDSLIVWARDYKIDGFRFDLMGHQPKDMMLEAREIVRAVDPDTYFYGEGWNFGEVADNARFVQATQLELAGTSIGTFTDRLRDAVRGGSSFVDGDELRKGQGLGNGLHTSLNELYAGPEETGPIYALAMDQARVGLAGNLAEYPIVDRNGEAVTGKDVPYGGAPAGYALDPADTINYVSKHDNQTLWDNNQYRIPFQHTARERARMQLTGFSYPLYAQGIPFLHMGGEFLRSKSFLRDSYNYGHWFNAVDFARGSNNYNVGLPPAAKDERNWEIIGRLIAANEGRDMATAEDIAFASDTFVDMIAIRSGSPLFSLATAEEIKARVSFLNMGEDMQDGLLVMSIDDGAIDESLADLDPEVTQLVVIFNQSPERKSFALDTAGLQLHPRQQAGADEVVKTSAVTETAVEVPGWTTAVFVRQ